MICYRPLQAHIFFLLFMQPDSFPSYHQLAYVITRFFTINRPIHLSIFLTINRPMQPDSFPSYHQLAYAIRHLHAFFTSVRPMQ